jgi:hypothetical protein
MKTLSTARTRPRFDAGVTNGTSVARTNTLIESAPASTSMATNAIAYVRVTPSTMVATPNVATALSSQRPT